MKVAARCQAPSRYPTPDRPARSPGFVTGARVLDTSALIGWPLPELSGGLVVASQEEELQRISPDRAAIIDGLGLVFTEPSGDSLESAAKAARESGDMSGLSGIDLALVALAFEKSAILVTDDYRMQNIAAAIGIEWQAVGETGITDVWTWELRCLGCGTEQPTPNSPNQRRRHYGECPDCGAALRLKKKR